EGVGWVNKVTGKVSDFQDPRKWPGMALGAPAPTKGVARAEERDTKRNEHNAGARSVAPRKGVRSKAGPGAGKARRSKPCRAKSVGKSGKKRGSYATSQKTAAGAKSKRAYTGRGGSGSKRGSRAKPC